MNILHIVTYKYLKPKNGGGYGVYYPQQYLGKIANLFVVGCQSNDHVPDLHFTPIPFFSESAFRYANPFNLFALIRYTKMYKADVLLIEHPYYAWMAFLICKITGLPLIIRSNNVEYLRFKSFGKPWWRILKWYETWAHKKANYVWCVTQEDKEQIRKDIGNASTVLLDLPYGTELKALPTDKEACRLWLNQKHHIPENHTVILFNGSLDYTPNRIGLDAILDIINPYLLEYLSNYTIVICGSKLPLVYNELKDYSDKHIDYAGFVDDVSIYFKGADLFLNPIIGGGGIKTKLVEALAFNTQTISSEDGAIGLYPFATGNMLQIIANNDWIAFAKKVVECAMQTSKPNIPQAFYDYYNWEKNMQRMLDHIHLK